MADARPPDGLIVLTAPSGAGKTTIAHRLMEALPGLRFSVSMTTRPPRPHERDGVDYHFVSEEAFRRHLAAGDLLEHEEVYPGRFYGTPLAEVAEATKAHPVLLDLDVKGALTVERAFGGAALTIFISPPSLDALEARLRARATETPASLNVRLARAAWELQQAPHFDALVVNDDLDRAVAETLALVQSFLAA